MHVSRFMLIVIVKFLIIYLLIFFNFFLNYEMIDKEKGLPILECGFLLDQNA